MLKLQSFRYLYCDGIFLPFKVFTPTKIRIQEKAFVSLKSRVVIGNPNKKSAIVSRQTTNLYFGIASETHIGKSVSIGPGVNIIVKNNANLFIGDGTYFTSDMHLEAVKSIDIGNDCAISWGVTIIDDDHHQILKDSSVKKENSVKIGNHVWIGCNVTILKGTIIGDNCIIGAGSVVSGIFPSKCLIVGNPARVKKENMNWE